MNSCYPIVATIHFASDNRVLAASSPQEYVESCYTVDSLKRYLDKHTKKYVSQRDHNTHV